VSGAFLVFDTTNGEARLSLKALQPNPRDGLAVGQEIRGQVTKVVPFGVFVDIVDGVGGLLHVDELAAIPEVGDEITVVVAEVDRARVRLRLPASSEWLAG
jgi:small subunit ribosomal protein S1